MDSKDLILVLVLSLIGILSFFLIIDEKADEIGLIGTIVTILALLFAIFQQYRLKTKSQKILDSKVEIIQSIDKQHYKLNLQKCSSLIDKINYILINRQNARQEYIIVVHFLDEIQTNLYDCKTILSLSYQNELENCINRYKYNVVLKSKVLSWINDCKTNASSENINAFKDYIKRVNQERFNIMEELRKQETDFSENDLLTFMHDLKNYLIQIKPLYSSLV